MTQEKTGCEKPEKLKGNPQECSSEQIRECHGHEEAHSCETPDRNADGKKPCRCRS